MKHPAHPIKLVSLTTVVLATMGAGAAIAEEITRNEVITSSPDSSILIAQAFKPSDRGTPTSTGDGGTRRSFAPADRGTPTSTGDGGTRRSFAPADRGTPTSTGDGGTRGEFTPTDRGTPTSTGDGGSRNFAPADRGTPTSTGDGGTRTNAYHSNTLEILVPKNALPLTVNPYPTFFWHQPVTEGERIEFTLLSEDGSEIIYFTKLEMPEQAGIMRVQLPQEEQYALKEGVRYQWHVSVVTDETSRYRDAYVSGWVERLSSDDPLAQQVANLEPTKDTIAYTDAGIWYESLENWLAKRDEAPENWQEFLSSVNLDEYVQAPVLEAQALE